MGSMKAKMKIQLNYRNGRKGHQCYDCLRLENVKISGIGGADLGYQYRCPAIGLGNSVKYRINPKMVCNEFLNK